MEAVAALLRGLPLQPEESDRGDIMEAKSQMFLKFVYPETLVFENIQLKFFSFSVRYFTLFLNLLNSTDPQEEEEDEMDVSRQRSSASKLTALRNATIQAMSNLLSANIDSGLMHSIGTVNCLIANYFPHLNSEDQTF